MDMTQFMNGTGIQAIHYGIGFGIASTMVVMWLGLLGAVVKIIQNVWTKRTEFKGLKKDIRDLREKGHKQSSEIREFKACEATSKRIILQFENKIKRINEANPNLADERITNPDITFVFSRNKLSKDNPDLTAKQIDSTYDAMCAELNSAVELSLDTVIHNVSQ